MAASDLSELRANVPRKFIDMLDAVGMAHGRGRTEQLCIVLEAWFADRAHEASLILAVVGRNPTVSEADRKDR